MFSWINEREKERGVYYYSQPMDCSNVHLYFLVCSAFLPFINCPAPVIPPPPFSLKVRPHGLGWQAEFVSPWMLCWDEVGIQHSEGWYKAILRDGEECWVRLLSFSWLTSYKDQTSLEFPVDIFASNGRKSVGEWSQQKRKQS